MLIFNILFTCILVCFCPLLYKMKISPWWNISSFPYTSSSNEETSITYIYFDCHFFSPTRKGCPTDDTISRVPSQSGWPNSGKDIDTESGLVEPSSKPDLVCCVHFRTNVFAKKAWTPLFCPPPNCRLNSWEDWSL